MPLRRQRAVFIYAMNPKAMCGVDMQNVFFVHTLSGPLKGSDITFRPKEHILTNPEEMEKAAAYLEMFPQVGLV